MRFASSEWFLLIPLFIAAGWFWRGWRLLRPLRMLCLALVVLLLARPQWRRNADGLDLWVLVDQSDSAIGLLTPHLTEWESILQKSKGSSDRMIFVDFAAEAFKRGVELHGGPGGEDYEGPRNATRLNSALRFALAQMEPDRASRLLAFTDGYSTEPLEDMAERLTKQGVPLDYRLPPRGTENDYRIAAFSLPARAQLREAVLGEVVILGGHDATVPAEVLRDGVLIGTHEVPVKDGSGRLRFADRPGTAGAHRYEVRITPTDDAFPGNNIAQRWLEVQAGPRVLLATAYNDDPLALALKAQGFAVEIVTDLATLHLGSLTGTKAVILNNVPAYKIDSRFIHGLDFFVNQQGGGLVMIGGKSSFAAGGWFGSPAEPLLPVSMEMKQEHRKLAVAMAIVMDRSGSMSVTVPGTSIPKMSLADEGAARSIELLGDNDMVIVIPTDTEPHPLSAGLVAVGPNRGALEDATRRVESMGGGIFVYNGLKGAWDVLKDAKVGQRHIILFADANDAKQPDKYVELLEEMRKEKCTVSVIGMGSEKDMDANFLKDVAKRGGGRIFFNADPNELPALFTQETVTLARSAFIDDPADVKGTAGWLELSSAPMEWMPKVDGYNLSYLRPGATQAAVTGDEYAAPLVAFWQRGAGKVAAISFAMGGDYSKNVRQWKQFGGFTQSLARWLMGTPLPPGIGLRTDLEGSRLHAELFYDDTWNERVAAHPPELMLAAGKQGADVHTLPWERLAPGHFRASLDIGDQGEVRGAVRVGDAALPFGPVNAATNPEWAFDHARLDELKSVSQRSGGAERVDLSDVWHAPRPPTWRGIDRWLLLALVIALLLEAWQTRTGWTPWRKRAAV